MVRKNLTKGDDELKHILASHQEVRFGVITHVHLPIKSIWDQDCIDSGV